MENLLTRFKNEVGNYCAVCAYIEMSLRSLQEEHKEDLASKESLLEFAKAYNICLSNCDPNLLAIAVPQYYILNIYRCFESFLQNLYRLIRKCENNGNEYKKANDESWLECINRRLGGRLTVEQRELYVICDYYHYIRNCAAHIGDDKEKASRKTAYNRIDREKCALDAMFNKLDAPNSDDKLSFDDFILFSRSAIKLAEAYWKCVQFDYVALIEALPLDVIKSFGGVRNKKERMEEKVKRYLQVNYYMDPATYSDRITSAVENRLDNGV